MAGLDGPFFVIEPFKTALELACSQQPLKLSRGHLRSCNVRDTDGGAMEPCVQRLQFSARNGNEIETPSGSADGRQARRQEHGLS